MAGNVRSKAGKVTSAKTKTHGSTSSDATRASKVPSGAPSVGKPHAVDVEPDEIFSTVISELRFS